MSQFDFGTIDPNTKNGTELAADLNSWRTAVHTQHRGSSRPTYALPGFGGLGWIDDTADPVWSYKIYNGVAPAGDLDIEIFQLNKTTSVVTFSMSSLIMGTFAENTVQLQLDRTGGAPTQELVQFIDSGATNNFSNVFISANRPGVIFRDLNAAQNNFRMGVNSDVFAISMAIDDDLTKDASGHFVDHPSAFRMDGNIFKTTHWGGAFRRTLNLRDDTADASNGISFQNHAAVVAGLDVPFEIDFYGGETTQAQVAAIKISAPVDWTASNSRTAMQFWVTPAGALSAIHLAEIKKNSSGVSFFSLYGGQSADAGILMQVDETTEDFRIRQQSSSFDYIAAKGVLAAHLWDYTQGTPDVLRFNPSNSGLVDFSLGSDTINDAFYFDTNGGEGDGEILTNVPMKTKAGFGTATTVLQVQLNTNGVVTVDEADFSVAIEPNTGAADNFDGISGGYSGQIVLISVKDIADVITIRGSASPTGGDPFLFPPHIKEYHITHFQTVAFRKSGAFWVPFDAPFRGQASFDLGVATESTITAGGAITYATGFHRLSANTGSADTLTDINGGTEGSVVLLTAAPGDAITITEAGNLFVIGTTVLNDANSADSIWMRKGSGSDWSEIGFNH